MMSRSFPLLCNYVTLIKENKNSILSAWLNDEKTGLILDRLGISQAEFSERFAGLMFDRFLESAQGKKESDITSFLGKMVAFFYNKEIASQDLFWLWSGLKDSLTHFFMTDRTLADASLTEPAIIPGLFKEASLILNEKFAAIFFEYTSRLMERQEALHRYSKLVEEHVIVSRTDLKGRINYVSDSFCDITEYTREELMGKPHNIIRHSDMPKELFKDMWETIQQGKVWEGKVKNSTRHGGFFIANTTVIPTYGGDGEMDGYVSFRHDITDKVNAEVDELTKTFNRRRFENEFRNFYLRAVSAGGSLSLIIMDLDNFKSINDTYGHLKGDEVLVEIAEVTKKSLRKNDIFARWGGEEFVILMEGAMHEAAVHKANQIRKMIDQIQIKEVGGVTCSFGAAQLRPGETREDFFNRTDALLYKAKKSGKNRVISA